MRRCTRSEPTPLQGIEELANGSVEIRTGGDHPFQAITLRIFATGDTKSDAVQGLADKLYALAAELRGQA